MRTILSLLLFSLFGSELTAQVAALVGAGRSQPSPIRLPRYHNHPLTPLLFEDFENPSGYDLVGWGEDVAGMGNDIDADYTSTVLRGTQSLFVNEGEDDQTRTTNSFAARSRAWGAAIIRVTNLSDPTDSTVLKLLNAAGNCQFSITFNNEGEVRFQFGCSGTAYQLPSTISANVTYNLWFEYWNDNGANCYGTVAMSTGPVRPTSGAWFIDATGTLSAELVSVLQIGKAGGDAGQEVDFILDHVLIDDEQINDYP